MSETLAIVGAGRVGRALGRRLRELGWKIVPAQDALRRAVEWFWANGYA